MQIEISKKDILWGYFAHFINLGAGLFTLPLILKVLSSEEVGFNYVLISINSIVVLFDMGFSSQFSRYLTYIYSGVQVLSKEGIAEDYGESVNEHLLSCTIKSAKRIYLIISLVALFFLTTIGTIYVGHITNDFSLIPNVWMIWILFCVSSFFNIYYLYLNAFLLGRGKVKEIKQATVVSKLIYLVVVFSLLMSGRGLVSVVIANFVSPFVFRFIANYVFFDRETTELLKRNNVTGEEIKELSTVLFYNAKKLGLIGILSACLNYASTIIISLFLDLRAIGSYGLMVQLVNMIIQVACIYFQSVSPQISNLLVYRDYNKMKKVFGYSMFSFYCISTIGLICLFFLKPILIHFNFNTQLPVWPVLIIFSVYKLLEQNQSLFSHLLLMNNDFVFFKSGVITGIFSFLFSTFLLWCGWGLYGVVLGQFFPLLIYAAWYWPLYSVNKYKIDIFSDIFYSSYICVKNKLIYGFTR